MKPTDATLANGETW